MLVADGGGGEGGRGWRGPTPRANHAGQHRNGHTQEDGPRDQLMQG